MCGRLALLVHKSSCTLPDVLLRMHACATLRATSSKSRATILTSLSCNQLLRTLSPNVAMNDSGNVDMTFRISLATTASILSAVVSSTRPYSSAARGLSPFGK